jgi:hypothetical protein
VLAERVRMQARRRAPGPARLGRRSRKTLLKLIARRRRNLREQTLREGARLYKAGPRGFARRLVRAHEQASRSHR